MRRDVLTEFSGMVSATSALDRRLYPDRHKNERFFASAMSREHLDSITRSLVEVQAFVFEGNRRIMLVTHVKESPDNHAGTTDICLSADEARVLAEFLIYAANEYEEFVL